MTKLDRTKSPEYKIIENISVPTANKTLLDNKIEVYHTTTLNKEISEYIFVFDGGVWDQKNLLEANACVRLMSEGTKNYSSKDISEKFDFYGANFSANSNMHFSIFKLMCLNKYSSKLLDLISDIFNHPTFDKKEFDLYKNRRKENLVVMLEEVDIIARNEIERMLYGENYPYGWSAKPKDYDNLKLEWIKDYYQRNINASNLKIFVTSNSEENSLKLLNEHFSDMLTQKVAKYDNNYEIKPEEKETIIEKPKVLQSAIRIGWRLFNRKHEDYLDFTLLSALLGGYFGSRLMQNIRQKKGYTYSIYSTSTTYKYGGYFEIVSEVNKQNKHKVVEEIIKEVEFLRNNYPSEEELQKMKSYMSGSILRSLDGVFSYSRAMVTFVNYNMEFDYYQRYFNRLKSITPERITELAKKYLTPNECYKVIVG